MLNLFNREPIIINKKNIKPVNCYALHSNKEGTFKGFTLNFELRKYVTELHIYVKPGEMVKIYSEPGSAIGVLLYYFRLWTK
jgi:hypothetical protein